MSFYLHKLFQCKGNGRRKRETNDDMINKREEKLIWEKWRAGHADRAKGRKKGVRDENMKQIIIFLYTKGMCVLKLHN
jgi:hypothetical protein